MRSIVWFRRDLRICDNRALYAACKGSEQVIAFYAVTEKQWQKHDEAECKIHFWLENLKILKKSLAQLNIPLVIIKFDSYELVSQFLGRFAEEMGCSKVYFNKEYEYNESKRDEKVEKELIQKGIKVFSFHDRLLIEPGKVLTGKEKPYTVFTPFRNKWAKLIFENDIEALPAPGIMQKISNLSLPVSDNADRVYQPKSTMLCEPGENAGQDCLQNFISQHLSDYSARRDFPAIEGTSRLSPYLSAGVISPRQCLQKLLLNLRIKDKLPDFSSSAGVWLNELIWRDFYSNVLCAFPRVSMGYPFRLITERIDWRDDEKEFNAWKNGNTGYPLVDAAMRQLNQTGWMHNRLRMVSAMFLSKHLLIDWRKGEKWFMQNLIDGDLAANNGGWQWSASTGTDAVPYFRVFNPYGQSKKYDFEGEFIRRFCLELKEVSNNALHNPEILVSEIRQKKLSYPEPVVEHSFARKRAIEAFKK
jgi:deoxyribodipyrimidine photo-lyase